MQWSFCRPALKAPDQTAKLSEVEAKVELVGSYEDMEKSRRLPYLRPSPSTIASSPPSLSRLLPQPTARTFFAPFTSTAAEYPKAARRIRRVQRALQSPIRVYLGWFTVLLVRTGTGP
jgi:hypothetical protein